VKRRAIVLVTLLAVGAGCAARSTSLRPTPSRRWSSTLLFAQRAVMDARYEDADSALGNFAERYAGTSEASESQFWRAFFALDPNNRRQSGPNALADLDAYFAWTGPRAHDAEAGILRRIAGALASLRMASDEAVSQADSARTTVDSMRTRADSAGADSAVRRHSRDEEVQRLRDSLVKAMAALSQTNQELERIKKRLAAPQP
jgi:hypothetical protein